MRFMRGGERERASQDSGRAPKAPRYGWKWVSAVGALIIGIAATVAVAAPSGGGGGSDQGAQTGGGVRFQVERGDLRGPGGPPGGPERDLSALAKELGVSTSKLRDALEATRDKLRPPQRPRPGARPSRAEAERICKEMTDALASELGKDGDEVRAAIKAVAKAQIEKDVDAKRLTRAQADRILERIDSAACPPPFLLGVHGGGCHHGPGDHGPGGPGDGRRMPVPPADGNGNGSNGAQFQAPAPTEAAPLV